MTNSFLQRNLSLLLVFACTLFGAAAQILIKTGAGRLTAPSLSQMIASPPLVAGYALYGISTVLLVLALRKGQLSVLYPVIALTYVWVAGLSVVFFKETLNPYKLAGVALIVVGVGVLGRGDQ